MKRVVWILAGAALFAAALFALLVLLLPRETLRTRIGEQIAAWTGRDVSLSGEPEIDVFPRLSVTLNDVQVGGPEGMEDARVVSMDRLTGTIRLLPLLIGRVEIGSFTMVRPVIRLVRDADDRRNWAFNSGAAALQLAFAGDVLLGEFLLENGAVIYEDRATRRYRAARFGESCGQLAERAPAARHRRLRHLARRGGEFLGRRSKAPFDFAEWRRHADRDADRFSAGQHGLRRRCG